MPSCNLKAPLKLDGYADVVGPIDPEGDFVEAIGRQHTAEEAARIISGHMKDWNGRIVKG